MNITPSCNSTPENVSPYSHNIPTLGGVSNKKCCKTEHMKHRCYFIFAMCGMSLYSWYNYSLFAPVDNSFFRPYYLNCLLMLFYLGWDTYHMITNPIIYRTDLMIHHSISLVVYLSYINNTPLQMSNVLIMECISLMNYIWRNHPQLLNLYRTLCILGIRMPLSTWMGLYYNPNIIYPYFQLTHTYQHYLYLSTLGNIYLFFIVYDIFILVKLYKPSKLKKLI